ncbi:MAG: hypothetical protein QOE26_2846 [Verrucomicrobiota bacterium]|jgi:hypothetical protein
MILLGLTGASTLPNAVAAPTFTVNSVVDATAASPLDDGKCETSANNGTCTLRAAIMKANHFPGGGVTIVIPAATYGLTIAPTGADDELTGDLNITASMTIQGAGAATTIINANKIDRVLSLSSAPTVTITGVTLRNGSSTGTGGGINSAGSLTLNSALVSGNRSGNGVSGGGILSQKTLILNNTVVSDNQAGGNGGGIFTTGTATVNSSFISGNLTLNGGYGGGILNNGTMTITDSLISGNQTLRGSALATSGKGGGIWNAGGPITILNSTISNNSALSDGGGIYNDGTVFTYSTTIAGNLAANDGANSGTGGGINNGSGVVNLRTTLVGQNYAGITPSDLSGTIASQDYNLIQSIAGATITGVTAHNITGLDPLLDSLHDNGGVTQTRALFAGSVAVDAIPTAQCTDQFGAPLTTDQRGAQRGNGGCDIGAYEGSISNSLYGRNLVVNGDADALAGSPTGATIGIPSWGVAGAFTAVPYNSAGGFPNLATDMVPANHGYGFFAGGNASGSAATQIISVLAVGSQIDTGKVAYTFSADLGGFSTDGDNATVSLSFRDGSGMAIGPDVLLGPVTPANRGNKTGFLPRSANGSVPAGTRNLRVVVTMIRSNGNANDGYADNISVVLTPPPTLAQISTRMAVQTGENVLFGGFIVTGTQPKKVAIRAIGPSLTNFGVQGALADPTLQLFNGSQQLLDSNDNWVDSPNKQTLLDTGLAPSNTLESAIVATLPANSSNYTAVLRGAGSGTGIGVVEVYDLDYAANARLANISARGFVQTGDNVMFGGFIVVGSGPQKVIVRAIGPSLTNFGVQGALSDPNLELHDGNGALLETNDNWTDSPNKQAIIDSGIPPSDPRESAIVRILDPAPFTAIVRGSGGATGVAVVEVYSLQ